MVVPFCGTIDICACACIREDEICEDSMNHKRCDDYKCRRERHTEQSDLKKADEMDN